MITHFTSDWHLGHENIIGYASRPHASLADMEANLLDDYRALVKPEDVVCFVGDISFYSAEETWAIIDSLPGYKILVRGNHDGSIARCLRMGFDIVVDAMYLEIRGQKITVAHRPQDGRVRGAPYIIHGHTHCCLKSMHNEIHVGVDAWNFRPATMREIEELIVTSMSE